MKSLTEPAPWLYHQGVHMRKDITHTCLRPDASFKLTFSAAVYHRQWGLSQVLQHQMCYAVLANPRMQVSAADG